MANPLDSSNAPKNSRHFRLEVAEVGTVTASACSGKDNALLSINVSTLRLLPAHGLPLVTSWYDDMIALVAEAKPIRIYIYHQGIPLCDYFLVPQGPENQQN